MQTYIGIDIGGTKTAISLGEWDNNEINLIDRREVPTTSTPLELFDIFAPQLIQWIRNYNVKKIGISCGGPLDSKKGIIVSTTNLSASWHGFEIVKYVNERFLVESVLENDANACAVAEWKFGAGKGKDNVVFLTFGTGLGAGLILDGKLYSGTCGNAGEIGHIRLAPTGPLGFNKQGSAEGFCSGNGIKRLAHIMAKEQGVKISDDITTKEIFVQAKNGNEFYLSVITESAKKFANVLSVLIDVINPQAIIVGGVFMRNYEFFMDIMQPILKSECILDSYNVCEILPAKINENIGDYAAISLVIGELNEGQS